MNSFPPLLAPHSVCVLALNQCVITPMRERGERDIKTQRESAIETLMVCD